MDIRDKQMDGAVGSPGYKNKGWVLPILIFIYPGCDSNA